MRSKRLLVPTLSASKGTWMPDSRVFPTTTNTLDCLSLIHLEDACSVRKSPMPLLSLCNECGAILETSRAFIARSGAWFAADLSAIAP